MLLGGPVRERMLGALWGVHSGDALGMVTGKIIRGGWECYAAAACVDLTACQYAASRP